VSDSRDSRVERRTGIDSAPALATREQENTMSDTITITGLIATTPRHVVTAEGLPITSFRLASSQRRFDKSADKWVDASTNWYTISAFRQLAINAVPSLSKGDRVVVTGRLRVRDWQNDDRTGTTVEIEAESIGHDLFWGTASFTRTVGSADVPRDSSEPATDLVDTAVPVPAL
jgi:single-strand DNA-binding protein